MSEITELIKRKIVDLPEQIKTQSIKIFELVKTIELLKKETKFIETKVCGEIILLKDNNNKLIYTNNEMRDLATGDKLSTNSEYIEKIKEIGEKENNLKLEQIELEYLYNLFRMYLNLLRSE